MPVTTALVFVDSITGNSTISSTFISGPTPSKSIIPEANLAPVYA